MGNTILIVEDDESLLPMITYNLKKKGFNVKSASTGEEGLILIKELIPDLLILDWMIPEPSGLEICRQIRQNKLTKDIPIIFLTAKGDEDNKITGLEAGADDYMVKPFSPNELIARINALLRRHSRNKSNNLSLIVSDLFLDLKEHKAYRDKKRINLGPTEFKLLKFFMENPKRVFSREQLLDSVWGHGIFVEFRTVDTHIRRLRKAINLPNLPDAIRTVRSAGYSLDLE